MLKISYEIIVKIDVITNYKPKVGTISAKINFIKNIRVSFSMH